MARGPTTRAVGLRRLSRPPPVADCVEQSRTWPFSARAAKAAPAGIANAAVRIAVHRRALIAVGTPDWLRAVPSGRETSARAGSPLSTQEGEHGEDAPVVLGGRREAELPEDAGDVLLDGALGDDEAFRDRLVRPSLGHQFEYLALARRQIAERVVAPPAADEPRDDRGVERGAALRDSADSRAELVDVGDPILEQIADSLGTLGQELHRVAGFDVLREHEHTRPGVLLADLLRGLQSLVRVRRRHADVDDRDVRPVRAHLEQELLAVARLTDDLEASLLEQPRDPLAQEHRVLGQHHTQAFGLRSSAHLVCGLTIDPQRRKVNREPRLDELEDPLRPR